MSKEKPLKNLAGELSILLANTYSLALKTQNYHWNITGPGFYSLHKLFEGQYEALHVAADELAERIRAIGAYAPGSFTDFLELTNIADAIEDISSKEMLHDLVQSHEDLILHAKKVISIATAAEDSTTADIVIKRIEEHEKQMWMLDSSL